MIGSTLSSYRALRNVTSVLALLVSVSLIGCNRVPDGHRKVTGVVLLESGEPLSGLEGPAVVRFDPADPEVRESRESIGIVGDDGRFVVMTYEGGDGVPLGDYKVVLTMEKFPDNYKIVPDPYTHYETTPWTAEVTADGNNHFELTLSPIEEKE